MFHTCFLFARNVWCHHAADKIACFVFWNMEILNFWKCWTETRGGFRVQSWEKVNDYSQICLIIYEQKTSLHKLFVSPEVWKSSHQHWLPFLTPALRLLHIWRLLFFLFWTWSSALRSTHFWIPSWTNTSLSWSRGCLWRHLFVLTTANCPTKARMTSRDVWCANSPSWLQVYISCSSSFDPLTTAPPVHSTHNRPADVQCLSGGHHVVWIYSRLRRTTLLLPFKRDVGRSLRPQTAMR